MSITEQPNDSFAGHSSPARKEPVVDDVALRILSVLRNNGRISMAALAERVNVSRASVYNRVDQMTKSDNPEIKRLLGTEGKFGEATGLTNDWGVRIVKHMGNYGEIFERNIGEGSPLKIKRGLNALWTKGGLQYGIPIR